MSSPVTQLSCPHCGFCKQVATEKIPAGVKRVKCPKCSKAFELPDREAPSPASPASAAATPAPEATPKAPGHSPDPATPARQSQPLNIPDPVTITCPHCKVSRNVPGDKIPARTVTLQCQQCKEKFSFDGATAAAKPTPETTQATAAAEKSSASASGKPSTPSDAPAETAPSRTQLSDIPELFSRSFAVFKRRILTLIGINLLAVVLVIGASFILGGVIDSLESMSGGNPFVMGLTTLVMAFLGLLVISAIVGAMVMAIVDEDLRVRPALALGIQRFPSFLWVFTLLGFIISGGYMAFFIPGVIFTVWFIFAQFVLAQEDVRGMNALLKSRAYVQGHFWGVLGRILVVAVACGVVSAIPFIGILFSLVAGPFSLIYYHEVYRDLTALKGHVSYTDTRGEKAKWLLAGASGYVLTILAFLFAVGPLLLQGASMLGDAPIQFNQDSAESTYTTRSEHQGTLSLERSIFAPGDVILVSYATSEGLPDNAWVGIIPTQVPHGDEAVNDQYDLSYQYLNRSTSGTMQFTAPQILGEYDLRLHDTDGNGVELASVTFLVSDSASGGAPPDSGSYQLVLSNTSFAPGERINLIFTGISSPSEQNWVGLFRVGDDDVSYGEYSYLQGESTGTLSFTAPQEPGEYEFRLFLNWPAGEYPSVARSTRFTVGPTGNDDAVSTGEGSTSPTPGTSPESVSMPGSGKGSEDVMVYVYAINYIGGVGVNGIELYPIQGERDMNYNYTGNTTLTRGSNLIDVYYKALPDAWMNKIELKVYQYNWDTGEETVISEWIIEESEGRKQYEIVLEN